MVNVWPGCGIITLPRRSHSMRRNHDGNARSGSSRASVGVGRGRCRNCANGAQGPVALSFGRLPTDYPVMPRPAAPLGAAVQANGCATDRCPAQTER
jgi:hypothetical protein